MQSKSIKKPPGKRSITINSLLIGLLIFLAILSLSIFRPQILDDIEGRLLDARFKLRGEAPTSGLVSLVAVDEKSIEQIGRWPWSREKLAELIHKIDAMGAEAVGLDIVFSEPQHSSIERVLENPNLPPGLRKSLQTQARQDDPDRVLSRTIKDAGNVVTGCFFYPDKSSISSLKPLTAQQKLSLQAYSAVDAIRSSSENFPAVTAAGIRTNIDMISAAGSGSGYFNFLPSNDGVIRNAYLVMRYQDDLYPSLALKTLSKYLQNAPIVVQAESYGIDHINLGSLTIPTDELGGFVLNYRGPAGTIPTYSALDVLNGNIPANALKGKMVLLGVTAIGVYDAHTTPFGPSFPGLEIQGNVAENIILGDAIHHTGIEILTDMAIIFFIILILSAILPRINGILPRFIASLAVIGSYAWFNLYLFGEKQLWINFTFPALAWLLTYIILNIYLSLIVERRYSTVNTAFQYYLHPELVKELTSNPELLQFGGEQRYLTILFSDIRNFTNISEGLTPQQLAKFIHCYMDPMTEQVLNHRGTLDKYIGDAVMAIFGAPIPADNHPADACNSALDMVRVLSDVQACCPELSHIFPINIGIGIHSGEVVVGNLGSSFHFTYTVLGDNVNLSSRLEGLTKQYGVNIIISESTFEHVHEGFHCRELDVVRVKGKQMPIKIYELISARNETTDGIETYLSEWDKCLSLYRNRLWNETEYAFSKFIERYGENKAAGIYLERCAHYKLHSPGEGWDGVTTFQSK
jgi:adenylate cyclase